MKKVESLIFFGGASIAVLLAVCATASCSSPTIKTGKASIVLMLKMPAGAELGKGSDPRLVAPGTAEFLVTVSASDIDPIVRTFEAPSEGGSATVEITGLLPGGDQKTISVVARDSLNADISSGSATVDIERGTNEVEISLSAVSIDANDLVVPASPFDRRIETLAAGEVRVLSFTPPSEMVEWADYSISAMYTPCAFAVYGPDLQRIASVGGTAEKWALVTENAARDPFIVVVANTTGRDAVPVELRLERAAYADHRLGSGGAGTRVSPSNQSLVNMLESPATDLPYRLILAATDSAPYTGDLSMIEGISLYGGFSGASGGWVRNPDTYTTRISRTVASGTTSVINVPASVGRATVLDGCTVTADDYVPSVVGASVTMNLVNVEAGAGPLIANNRILGPAPQFSGDTLTASHEITGIRMTGPASVGPVVAFNDVLGGSLNQVNGQPTSGTKVVYFIGLAVRDYTTLSGAPRVVGNDIVGWLGIAEPYADSGGGIDLYGRGASLINSSVFLNNTVEVGRIVGSWPYALPTYFALDEIGMEFWENGNTAAVRNNAIGSCGEAFGSAHLFYDVYDSVLASTVTKNFFYIADIGFNLARDSTTSYTMLDGLPSILSGNLVPNGDLNAAQSFVAPYDSARNYFGDRHLSGAWSYSSANPATSGADLASDSALSAVLSDFERDFLRWDRDGRARTAPWSIGAYEYE